MKKSTLTFILFFLLSSLLQGASKRVVLDSVKVKSDLLMLDFTTEGIIDQKVSEGLQKGLTSTIEYQIQLWEKKSGWINNLVSESEIRMKVFYDNWENKYVIMSRKEKRLTSSLETVREKCSLISDSPIYKASQLDSTSYYFVTIKVILQPLSVENYQEIKNWLSGEAKNFQLKKLGDTQQQEKKIKGGMFKMLMALTGFGDRVISGKSEEFSVQGNRIIWKE